MTVITEPSVKTERTCSIIQRATPTPPRLSFSLSLAGDLELLENRKFRKNFDRFYFSRGEKGDGFSTSFRTG